MITVLQKTDAITKLKECQKHGISAYMLHVVNCQGVMGSGIAKQVKERVPSAYEIYMKAYTSGDLFLGNVTSDDGVVNLASQDSYGSSKRHLNYGALAKCLDKLESHIVSHTHKIIVPYNMGCDRAGGDWEVVLEMLDFFFDDVIVCDLN